MNETYSAAFIESAFKEAGNLAAMLLNKIADLEGKLAVANSKIAALEARPAAVPDE